MQGYSFPLTNHLRQQTRLAYGLIPLLNFLKQAGIDSEAFLIAADIPAFGLVDPLYTISLEKEMEVMTSALPYLTEPHAGLDLAKNYHLHNYSVIGLALRACADAAEMMALVEKFPNLVWGVCETIQQQRGDIVSLQFIAGSARLGRILLERDMGCAVALMREVLVGEFPLREVRLTFPKPQDTSVYEDFYRCPVRFAQSSCEIDVHVGVMRKKLPSADVLAKLFHEAQCAKMSEAINKPFSYSEAVRERLYRSATMPTMEQMAALLNTTTRTLQRRLVIESSRFSDLLRQIRQRRAEERLAETVLRIEDIAEELGFMDAVAFSHAFRRWTGHSPREWRTLHQES